MSEPKTQNSVHKVAVPRQTVELLIEEHNRHPDSPYLFMSPKTLASMLGHYSAGFTLDTYIHVTHQMQQSAAERIGGFVTKALESPEPPEPTSASARKIIPFQRVG